jgi:hypothetical protein
VPKSWTDGAPAPVALQDHAHLRDPLTYKIKKWFLGGALNRHSLDHQRLKKRYALGILSSDCISSSAYGSEQILIALLPAFGLAAFTILMPMTGVVLAILVLITLSYRNVIQVYTKTGGAYVVSRDNFGPVVAQIAAVALMLDYIVTLAIQSAAGVAAIQLDCPRAVSVTIGTGTIADTAITVTGLDVYGQAMTDVIQTGTTQSTTVNGEKAFFQITGVAVAGAVGGTVAVGTTDILGSPVRITTADYIARAGWAGALAEDAGTFVAAVTTTATTTSGDVRGTYVPSSAPNGTRRLVMGILLPAIASGPNATRVGALGVTQA